MKAVRIHEYGDVDQLRLEEIPTPPPGAGEVLVRVLAASINPVDWKIRSGAAKDRIPVKLPFIPGRDVAGEVASLGDGVNDFKPGQHVMGLVNNSYAEYLVAKASALTAMPPGLSSETAGSLPLVLLTGAQLVEHGIEPKSGDTVLITGALGSVGRTAVFVAKQHGAKVIAGVRAKQKEEARELGAEQVVAIDDDAEISSLPQLDAIGDTVNGETITKLLPKLKKGGRLGSVLGKPSAADQFDVKVVAFMAQPDAARLHQLAADVQKGLLVIPISRQFPLSEVQEAQKFAEKGAKGKIVLIP